MTKDKYSFLFSVRPHWKSSRCNVKLHSRDWVDSPERQPELSCRLSLSHIAGNPPLHRNRQRKHDFVNQKQLKPAPCFLLRHLTLAAVMPPVSLLGCWFISYPRENPFPSLAVFPNFTFSLSQFIIRLQDGLWPPHAHPKALAPYANKRSRCVCLSLGAAPYIYGFANGLHGPSACPSGDPVRSTPLCELTSPGLTCSDSHAKEIGMSVEPHRLLKPEYVGMAGF